MTTLAEIPTHLMTVDFDTSTVTLAGRRFPAVGIIVPNTPGEVEEPRHLRYLSGPARFPNEVDRAAERGRGDFHVPCENGVLVEIGWYENRANRMVLELHVYSRNCTLHTFPVDTPLYLPYKMGAIGNRLVSIEGPALYTATWEWQEADPEWVGEFLDRVSRMEPEKLDGPEVEVISISDLWELVAEGKPR